MAEDGKIKRYILFTVDEALYFSNKEGKVSRSKFNIIEGKKYYSRDNG